MAQNKGENQDLSNVVSFIKCNIKDTLKDLKLCQKKNEFLEKYRNLLIEFSGKCVCNQNKSLIDSIESLESQYNQLFNEVGGTQSEQTVEGTDEDNETSLSGDNPLPEKEVQEVDKTNNELNDSQNEGIVETTIERTEDSDSDVIIIEDDDSVFNEDTIITETEEVQPIVEKHPVLQLPSLSSIQQNVDKSSENLDQNNKRKRKQTIEMRSYPLLQTYDVSKSAANSSISDKNNVLIYNLKDNSIIRKSVENIDEKTEYIVESLVYKEFKEKYNKTNEEMVSTPKTHPKVKGIRKCIEIDSNIGLNMNVTNGSAEEEYVLTFDKKNNTIIRKSAEDIDEQKESVIEEVVLKPFSKSKSSSKPTPKQFQNFLSQTSAPTAQASNMIPKQPFLLSTGATILIPSLPTLPSISDNKSKGKAVDPKQNLPLLCGLKVNPLLPMQTAFFTFITPAQSSAKLPIPSRSKRRKRGENKNEENSSDPTPPPPPPPVAVPPQNRPNRRFANKINDLESVLVKGKIEFTEPAKDGKAFRHYSYDSIDNMREPEKIDCLRRGLISSFICKNNDSIECFMKKRIAENGEEVSELMFKCTECGHEFKSKYNAVKHLDKHYKTPLQTPIKKLRRLVRSRKCVLIPDFKGKPFSAIYLEFPNQETGRTELSPEQGYKCDHINCDYICIPRKTLNQHLNEHENGRQFQCDICCIWFGTKQHLTKHKNTVHNDNRPVLKCPTEGCNYETINSFTLYNHKKSHYVTERIKCTEIGCDSSFKSENALETHVRYVHNDYRPHRCHWEGCDKAYKRKEQLKNHLDNHKNIPLVECDLCDKSLKNERKLLAHKIIIHNIRNKPWIKCKNCSYKTTSNLYLKVHQKIHVKNRPFKCDQIDCNKTFKTKYCLNFHKKYTHSEVRPYLCDWPGCAMAFKQNDKMIRHLRTHTTDDIRFYCDYCDNSYKYKSDMRTHIRRKHF